MGGGVCERPKYITTDTTQKCRVQLVANSLAFFPTTQNLRQCAAEDLPFAAGEVDLVTAMTAAHWFDRRLFFQEADRVLRPGGCLALLSYTLDMELEYGDVSSALNNICKEVRQSFWMILTQTKSCMSSVYS